MRAYLLITCAVALQACGTCEFAYVDAAPTLESGPVSRLPTLSIQYQGDLKDADVVVTSGGDTFEGTTTIGDGLITWRPSNPLPENATIAWALTACDGGASGEFSTGTLDSPVEPASLEGKTYALDLANATWISPEGAGVLIASVFGGAVLIGVQSASDTELDCLGSSGQLTSSESWQQDPCFPTIDFQSVDFSNNPYFEIVSPLVQFEVQGITAVVHDVSVSGGLTADAIVDGNFSGEIDMREYTAVLQGDGCDLIESYLGISCVECRSDSSVDCLWIEATNIGGARVPALTLVENPTPEECDVDTDTGGN